MNERRVYALVFAAGPSTRMGEPKLLMRYAGQTILETVLDSVLDSSVDGAVIVANPMIANVLEGVLPEGAVVAVNYEPHSPLVISAKLGMSKLKTKFKPSNDDGVLMVPCDRPQISMQIMNTCAELFRLRREAPQAQISTYQGSRDYPVVVRFDAALKIFDQPDVSLEDLWSNGAEVGEVPIADMTRPIDVDTPQDYAELCALEPPVIDMSDFVIPFRPETQMHIAHAESDEQIQSCHAVMAELRPHVHTEEFVSRVRRQQAAGYRLLFVEDAGKIRALAGYRISENLPWGKFLYVDDLVTAEVDRSKGYGEALMNWLIDESRRQKCEQLHLDSGVHRFAAHRFYLAMRMDISSHHFSMKL